MTFIICCAITDVLIARSSASEVAAKGGWTFTQLSASSSIRYAFLLIKAFCLHYRSHLRKKIFFHRLWYTVNAISQTGLCKWHVSLTTKVDVNTVFAKGPKNERCTRELIFWNMYLNIYIFERFHSDLVWTWHKSGRGIDENLFFKDLLRNCVLTRQLLKCKQWRLSAAASLSVSRCLSPSTVDRRTSNLSCMIIRRIQRMKQAYVHV